MNEQNNKNLEKENEELKAQIRALSTLNPALYTGVADDSDEIDLKELWSAIWSGKWLIIGITFVFSVASVLYALSLPDEYKSTALLAPASSSSSSQLGKLAGQFGGLASLAGINLGGGGAEDKTVIAMEIMKTWGFLEKFIKDNNIEVEVFAAEGWDRATDTLKVDPDLYDVGSSVWTRKFDPKKGETAKPSSWELFEKFEKRVSIDKDKKSGIVSLSVEHYSPIVAKALVSKLVKAINRHMQLQDREEASKSIEYLSKKINETNVSDMQSVFYQLVEEQTKNLMLTEVQDEYVFRTIGEAKIQEKKSAPNRPVICVFGAILGIISGLAYAIAKYYIWKT